MVRCSLIIAGHNEGDRLWRTVQSCVETCSNLDYEIVISDDASTDGSVEQVLDRFPQVRLTRHSSRLGVSPTKDSGARLARGEVLIFLDGHVKPEPGAIAKFVEDVEHLNGNAIVTPTVFDLDPATWQNRATTVGNGYTVELTAFQTRWIPLAQLRLREESGRTFYECPALIGCACAVSRELYERLRGFDRHMSHWGLEDVDFGLKSWLMGHPILHDPEIHVGHRFQEYVTGYRISWPALIVNQLRTARKHLSETLWCQWVERCRSRFPQTLSDAPEGIWTQAWMLFQQNRASVESERSYLLGHRVHDEFWFANRFELPWPKLRESASTALPPVGLAATARNGDATNSVASQAIWGSEVMLGSPQPPRREEEPSIMTDRWREVIWGEQVMQASPQPNRVIEVAEESMNSRPSKRHGTTDKPAYSSDAVGNGQLEIDPETDPSPPFPRNGQID